MALELAMATGLPKMARIFSEPGALVMGRLGYINLKKKRSVLSGRVGQETRDIDWGGGQCIS